MTEIATQKQLLTAVVLIPSLGDMHPRNSVFFWALWARAVPSNDARRQIFVAAMHVLLCISPADAATYRASILNSTEFYTASSYALSATDHVGWAKGASTNHEGHALLWRGASNNPVDLHPAAFRESQATSISGTLQGGFGYSRFGGEQMALLWSGTAESVVVLHPDGFRQKCCTRHLG